MSQELDDLEAVRTLVSTLEPFDDTDRTRIIRWASEKLGLSSPTSAPEGANPAAEQPPAPRSGNDIKSFMDAKQPKSDAQFTTAVAYYYQFEAPPAERTDSINSDILQEACRKAGRARLTAPSNTLNNALKAGYLDKAGERGYYKVNSVGENLVAMVLPDGSTASAPRKRTAKKKTVKKKAPKKTARRKSAKKKAR